MTKDSHMTHEEELGRWFDMNESAGDWHIEQLNLQHKPRLLLKHNPSELRLLIEPQGAGWIALWQPSSNTFGVTTTLTEMLTAISSMKV
jgi:hypothetical protein